MEISCPNCKKKQKPLENTLSQSEIKRPVKCLDCGELIPLSPEMVKANKEKLLKKAGALPPMPEILIRARAIIDSPYADIKDLADLLEKDQAITSRLLKLSNSAYYGLRNPVESAYKACLVLGEEILLQMITLVSTSKLFGNSLDGYGRDAADIFSHTLFVAIASQKICEKNFKALEAKAFATGLLHDSGMLILDPHIKENKDEYLSLIEKGLKQEEAEYRLFGFDHSEIGYDFCINWKMTEEQALAIRWHHSPEKSDTRLAHILYAANKLSWQDPEEAPERVIKEESFSIVGLSNESLSEIRSETWQNVAQIVADILIP